ncbi:uncharacterized protein LOC118161095 [Oxyura jamaicensis]|uniref:uncharacterized protein LOC118161095 n=1 Tax=Oxyura jamaicensis TaxID=8884 RepID=UPI0015A5D2CC|nr:uncharacterized protein LOC118161095 [Oxyura jamaicensis]
MDSAPLRAPPAAGGTPLPGQAPVPGAARGRSCLAEGLPRALHRRAGRGEAGRQGGTFRNCEGALPADGFVPVPPSISVSSPRSETLSQDRCSGCSSAPPGESCQRARTASEVLSTPRESCLLPKFPLNSGAPAVRLRAGSPPTKCIARQCLRNLAKHTPGGVCTDPFPGASGVCRTSWTSRAGSSVHRWTGTVISLLEASGLHAGIQKEETEFGRRVERMRIHHTGTIL